MPKPAELLLEAREAAAAVEQMLLAAGPGRVRLRVDVELQLVARLAPGGAGGELGSVGHDDLDGVIVGMDVGFHAWFPAPLRRYLLEKLRLYSPRNRPKQAGAEPAIVCRRVGPCNVAAHERCEAAQRRRRAATPAETRLPAPEAPARRMRVRPLLALVPYVMRYRGQALGALVALLVAARATLAVPLAVRRMIDFGFSAERIALIDQYFAVMIAVAAVLAAASALRYYLVTIIGERVVADLRAAVFAHLTELSPAFFDTAKTGETHLAAHRRHHADQERGRLVGLGRAAQHRAVHRLVGDDGGDEPAALRSSCIAAIPVIVLPLVAFGRAGAARARAPRRTRSPTLRPMRPS